MASWWLAFHRRLQFGKKIFAENVSRWKTLTICLPESWLMSLTFKDPKYLSTLSSNIKSFCTKENHVKCTFAAFWSRIETTRAGFWQSVGWTKCRQCCPAVCWKSRKVCEGLGPIQSREKNVQSVSEYNEPYAARFETVNLSQKSKPYTTGTLLERVAIDFSRLPTNFRSQIVLGIHETVHTKRTL